MSARKMAWFISVTLILLCLTSLMGCAGSGSPVVDPGIMDNLSTDRTSSSDYTKNRGCWGWWQVHIDTETLDVNIEPLRSAAFTCNVTMFMQPPISPIHMLSISIDPNGSDPANGLLDIDVTLSHPFPGLAKFRGFDVRGIFMADLGEPALVIDQHDPSLLYNQWNGPRLLNADGYSRWWNYLEFTTYGTIFGYTPAAFAIPKSAEWHSRLNPYKYFADELGIDDEMSLDPANRGTFSTLAGTASRDFLIQFAMDAGGPVFEFAYAIDASWSLPDPAYDPDYPVEAFDLPANCQEAYQISVSAEGSTLWYQNDGSFGGNLNLEIEVFDWQSTGSPLGTPGEVAGIYLSTDIAGIGDVDITTLTSPTAGSGVTSSIWTVDFGGLEPYAPTDGFNRILVTVESADPNTYAPGIANPGAFEYPDSPLAAFQWVHVPIGNEPPPELTVIDPNGGEIWFVGEENDIEWSAPPEVTDVMIEYSKDGFSADINEIIDTTPNDGSYTWEIPNDPSETVRVRVSDVGDPGNNDISDEDFEIAIDGCTPVFTEKWSYDLPGNGFIDSKVRGGFTLADLEGDGYLETLVLACITKTLYCFDHEGNIKWEFACNSPVSGWYGAPAVGEFTGDDILDVVISNDDMSGSQPNLLYVVDGSDGSLVYNISCGDIFSCMPSLGDVVGATNSDPPDGQLDIFVSRYDNPDRYNACYNGIDGNLVWEAQRSYTGGTPGLADMDLDGDLDCVVAGGYYGQAPDANGIHVLRGEAEPVERLIWEADHGSLIFTPTSLHDYTGDGIPDIIVNDYNGHNVECLDGSDGSVLWGYDNVYSHIGNPALGDLNSDGYPDVVIEYAVIPNPTRVLALNGDPDASERLLWSWHDPDNNMDSRGSVVLCDVTCDGIPDVLAGIMCWDNPDSWGKLWIIDGETGVEITCVEIEDDAILFGAPAVGDIDNDGETDVVFGTHDHSVVYAYGLGTPWPDNHDERPWPMYLGNIRNTGLYGDEF